MIVLAESNFVIELALEQEEAAHAQRIVELAEAHQIALVIPACAFAEPYHTSVRRRRERRALVSLLEKDLRQLGRSKSFTGLLRTSDEVARILRDSEIAEARGLDDAVQRLTACCRIPALSQATIDAALQFRRDFELKHDDSIVFASIEAALRETGPGTKIFVNKNSKDFETSGIQTHLQQYGCKIISSFAAARQFIDQAVTRREH